MEILKCPFCGSEETKYVVSRGRSIDYVDVFRRCVACKAQGPNTTIGCKQEDRPQIRASKEIENISIEQWNMRNEG